MLHRRTGGKEGVRAVGGQVSRIFLFCQETLGGGAMPLALAVLLEGIAHCYLPVIIVTIKKQFHH